MFIYSLSPDALSNCNPSACYTAPNFLASPIVTDYDDDYDYDDDR